MSDPLTASQRQPEPSNSSSRSQHPLERRVEQPQPQPAAQQPQTRLTPYAYSKPTVTIALIGINVLIFVIDQYVMQGQFSTLGEKANAAILAGEYWRLITPVFLHANVAHIAANSISLYYIGRQVEALYGSLRFTAMYILCGISGVVLSFALVANPSLGASGAIFGLVGALLLFFYRNRSLLHVRDAIQHIVIIIVIQIIAGLASTMIDNAGHIGGLICGIGLGWFMTPLFKIVPDYTGGAAVKDGSSLSAAWVAAAVGLLLAGGAAELVITLYKLGILHLQPL